MRGTNRAKEDGIIGETAFPSPRPPGERRREFLYVATGTVGAIGLGVSIWPLIDALNPSADVLSLASIEIDLSGMEIGQRITATWRGRPVFIWRRSEATVAEARATPLGELKDPVDYVYENPNHAEALPALDENRTADPVGEWLIVIGICTHLGCVPLGQEGQSVGQWGGWFCPCHGSHYDHSGRIRKGPAPRNLDIPPYTLEDDILRIG